MFPCRISGRAIDENKAEAAMRKRVELVRAEGERIQQPKCLKNQFNRFDWLLEDKNAEFPYSPEKISHRQNGDNGE